MIDCHTRELLGWHLSRSGKSKTAQAALEQALITRFGCLGRVTTPFLLRTRNEAVTALKAGELKQWKKDSGYHQRSIAETAMYRFKQATHRANAEPAELQRPGGRNPGWREGDEQADRAWYACSPASELSGINGLGNGHPATDLINNAELASSACVG